MDHKETNNQQPKKSATTPILIILVLLLLGAIVYFYMKNNELQEQQVQQQQEISETYLKLDSVSRQLEERIATIERLGGDIDTLMALKQQLEQDKRFLLTKGRNQKKTISSLNRKVNGYKELLIEKDKEIAELKGLNDKLMSENNTLKVEKDELNQSIRKLEENREQLQGKVSLASQLKVSGLKVYAVNSRGKERESEFRNRHIDKLKIAFTVDENSVAPIEGKDLMVRIIAPGGKELFDVTKGSGSFTFQGRELFYTLKQEILYDKTSQKVSCLYVKGSDYASGRYQVEVYTEDYLMGKGSFRVK